MEQPPLRPAYRIDEFCREFGIGRTTTYDEIREGRLRAFKIRGRTLIAGEDAVAWRDITASAPAVSPRRRGSAAAGDEPVVLGGSRDGARGGVDFEAVNRAALAKLPLLLGRWLPGGQRQGPEYVARNPTRPDRRPGSFKVNLTTGRWADFASGDKGGDPVSLAAYLFGLRQGEAARRLAAMLEVR